MTGLEIWLAVALAGAAGAAARLVVDGYVLARTFGRQPLGTAVVNVSGAFALGLIIGADPPRALELVIGTGFVGAYTTFSTWMLESLLLGEAGRFRAVVVNLAGLLVLGLIAAGSGYLLGTLC